MRRVGSSITQLSYRAGLGALGLAGLPFFAFGIFIILLPVLGVMKTKGQPAGAGAVVFVVLFGLVFATVGAVLLFGRSGIIFDKAARTVTRWYGLLFPMWTKVHELANFSDVSMGKETRKHKNSAYIVFPVRLVTTEDDAFDISEPRDEQEARKLAEEIAKFLNFDIVDSTSGPYIRREKGTLDESLRDRLQRTGEAVDISSPPRMRSKYSAEGNTIIFNIPPPPFNPALIPPVIIAVLIASIAVYKYLGPLLSDTKASAQVKWIYGGFMGLFFILLPIGFALGALIAGTTRRVRVEADVQSLRIRRTVLIFSRTATISGEELEELRLDSKGKPQLAALSDRRTEHFGEGLSREELKWMRAVILKAVTA